VSDWVPYLLFTIGPALLCLGLYIAYCVQVVKAKREAGPARCGPVGTYPTIQLAHLADVFGGSNLYFLRFELHSIGLRRPEQSSTVATLICQTCASELTRVIRNAAATRRRRCLWFALATVVVAVSGIAAGIAVATFDPYRSGAEHLLGPFIPMAAILALAILAQLWQREDGVSLRGQSPLRTRQLRTLRYDAPR
jgi:hypothetical protein